MTRHTKLHPTNPETALLNKGSRPSLEWIRFALEELSGHTLESGFILKAFVRLTKRAGYHPNNAHEYLEYRRKRPFRKSLPEVLESEAVIEKLIG